MNLTVSGLNKKFAMPYLLESNDNCKELVFEKFGETCIYHLDTLVN